MKRLLVKGGKVKRTLLVVGVALGALVAAGIAWSSELMGNGPAQIRIYGGGEITAISRTISLDAHANPDGLGAYGSFRYAGMPPGFPGEITCLSVVGNAAVVGGFIRQPVTGIDFLYGVVDSGLPASHGDQAGFIDVNPELDPYPGLPADFPRRVRQRRVRRTTLAPTR
jgi:hypothetical protein